MKQNDKLIGMREFVLEQSENMIPTEYVKYMESIVNYAKFLSQPLTLGMFVPTHQDGNVLEEPKHWSNNSVFPFDGSKESSNQAMKQHDYELNKYNEAKQLVLFEGFEVSYQSSYTLILESLSNELNFEIKFTTINGVLKCTLYNSIDELSKYPLTLTQTAKQQIYGDK